MKAMNEIHVMHGGMGKGFFYYPKFPDSLSSTRPSLPSFPFATPPINLKSKNTTDFPRVLADS
jgi:hypothetical protein